MKKTDTKITRYEDGDFLIDIVEDDKMFEAWLCRGNFAEYIFMFGCEKEFMASRGEDRRDFIAMVVNNLDDYKDYYDEEIGYYEIGGQE